MHKIRQALGPLRWYARDTQRERVSYPREFEEDNQFSSSHVGTEYQNYTDISRYI